MSINPRKRPLQDRVSTQTPGPYYNVCKRQRCFGITPQRPSFWDNLSKVHLTETALQELDYRNSALSATPCRAADRDYTLHYSAGVANKLRRFSRQGGPDMSEARGAGTVMDSDTEHQPSIPMGRPRRAKQPRAQKQNPTPTSSSQTTTSTRNSTPYDRNSQQHLIDHNIFPHKYEYPDGRVPQLPSNWEEIQKRLCTPLDYQITEEDFRLFQKRDAGAFKEKQVSTLVMPLIEGPIKDVRCVSGGIPFCNLCPLTDGTIAPGNPDIFYGARPEQLDQSVREELKSFISPSTQDNLPICPNFFVETKGPDGSLAVAMRQALYDGALGARGMLHLRSYKKVQLVHDNIASSITSIYHGGTLKIFTVHCTESVGSSKWPAYYINQLNAWAMDANKDAFEQGVTAYVNLKVWAEEQRNDAIENANRVFHTLQGEVSAPVTPTRNKWIEGQTTESISNDSSDESTQYATPPMVKHFSTIESDARLPSSSLHEASDPETHKRNRQMQSTSPEQQKKRNRVQNLPDYPSPESGMVAAGGPTGLSFQLEDQSLEQEQDDIDRDSKKS